MRLGDQLRQQLAAKALKRQLDRVTKELETGAERAAATVHNGQAAQPATPADYAALCRFDTLPAYQQVSIIREVSERMGIASPFFRVHEGVAGATTQINGQSYINFANYNYLGLAGDSVVSENAKAAIDQYGTSASASRMVAGERPIQRDLERALADLYEVDDCVAFVSGHATNVTTIGCLFGPGDLILHDALAHNSIVQGAQLSGAKRLNFPHNDWAALDALLTRVRRDYRRVLIAVEGIYSMDGDFPELERFIDIKRRHGAFLMVDEAHSLGVLGATGRGIREHFGLAGRDVDIWMGTFSKTLAGCGGYIAGEQALIDPLQRRLVAGAGCQFAERAAAHVGRATAHRYAARARTPVPGDCARSRSQHGSQRRILGRAGHRRQFAQGRAVGQCAVRKRHQHATDLLSSSGRESRATALLHLLHPHAGTDRLYGGDSCAVG